MREVTITNNQSPFFGQTGLATKTADGKYLIVYLGGQADYRIFDAPDVEVTGPATVLMSTRLAYNQIKGETFPIRSLVNRVRSITERDELMDGTILRRLRELREAGHINYEIADNHKAIYRKL